MPAGLMARAWRTLTSRAATRLDQAANRREDAEPLAIALAAAVLRLDGALRDGRTLAQRGSLILRRIRPRSARRSA